MPDALEYRVDRLEAILGQFIVQTNTSLNRLERGLEDFKDEMADFKDEMADFKNEMTDFKNEMTDFKNEMTDFKDEMKGFKDETLKWQKEIDKDRKQMNKQWGELANKMGTIVEDIVAPAVRPVVTKYFNCDINYFAINVRKKIKDLQDEFDVIAVSEDKVFLVEVKSTPKLEYVYLFKEKLERFRKLFPEYNDKKLIPIFASLRFEDSVINLASKENIYVLAYREWEYMDILNFDKVKLC